MYCLYGLIINVYVYFWQVLTELYEAIKAKLASTN